MESLNAQLQPFLEWLLRTTLQASILICAILLLQTILRSRLGIRWHYCLWLLLLVRMALPWTPQSRASIFNLVPQSLPQRQTAYARQEVDDQTAEAEVKAVGTDESAAVPTTSVAQDSPDAVAVTPRISEEAKGWSKPAFSELVNILPLVWLAGALVLGIYICANNFALLRIVRRQRPLTDQKVLDLLEDCKAQMGIRIVLGVVPTEKLKSPALFGFVRPRLLLPEGMIEALSPEELRYVFLHELAHLKRHDIYVGWLMSLLQVLHWFNPLIWLAFYRMRADRELTCDALVLARTQSGREKDYGRIIVSLLERFSRSPRLPAMAGILETKAQLKRRITMIAEYKKNSYRWSPLAVILMIILACISLPDAIGSKTLGISWPKSEPSISLRRIKTGPMSDFSSPPSLDGRYLCDVESRAKRLVIRDLVTGEVRALTEVSEGPLLCPVISPESKHVAYIHQSWSSPKNELQLIRIDGTGHRVIYRFGEGEQFYICTWTPDGKQILGAYQKNDEDLQLVLFSIEDGSMQVIHTFETYWPSWRSPLRRLAISPDGRYIAYERPQKKGSWDGDIVILDIEHQQTERVVQHSTNDRLLGWTPDGNYLFFASSRRQGLPGGFTVTDTWDAYLLPVAEGRQQGAPELIKRDIPGKIRPKGFTRDGAYYYAIEFSAMEAVVAKLDLQTGKLLTKPHAVGQTGADQIPAWSPDGRYLAYCVHQINDSQTIRIRNMATGQERELDPNLPHFSWLRWSPDGKSFLVSNFDKKLPQAIYRINVSTGERVAVVKSESSDTLPRKPQLSPDGSTLYYVLCHSDSKRSLVIRDMESGGEKELFSLDGTGHMRGLTFTLSPDGQQLALATQRGASSGVGMDNRILIMPAKGGEPRELWKTEGQATMPIIAWTPDGQALLFTKRIPQGGRELWLVPTGAGQARKLCSAQEMMCQGMMYGGVHSALDMHPDGQRIAFDCFEYRHEVWVMENFLPEMPVAKPEPATTLRMVTDQWKRGYASLSADGKYMTELDLETDDLVVREIATGKKQRLASGKGYALDSLISPDGKKVVYFWDGPTGVATGLYITGIDGSERRLLRQNEYLVPRDWSADGKRILGILFDEEQNRMVWVSTSDGTMDEIKPIGKAYPYKVDLSPDERFIAYDRPQAESTSKRDIFIFDILQNLETCLVEHSANDRLLGWTPNGQCIFFASDRTRAWDGWLLNVEDGKAKGMPRMVQANIGNVTPIGFTQSGDYYFGRYYGQPAISIYTARLNLDMGEVLAESSIMRYAVHQPRWSPDGRFLAYCSRTDENSQIIHIHDMETGRERVLDPNLPRFDWLCWCPDSQSLLATSFKETPHLLYSIDAQTGQRHVLHRSETGEICAAELSLDGKSLFYLQGPEGKSLTGKLIVKDVQTNREREILRFELNYGLPWWSLSPDGASLVIGLHEREGDVLKMISIKTGQTKDLFRSLPDGRIETIAWMPDGNNVLFWLGPANRLGLNDQSGLWRISAEGGQAKNLWIPAFWTQDTGAMSYLDIHPDGQRIAFGAVGLISQIWVMENFLPEAVAAKPAHQPNFRKIRIPTKPGNGVLSPDGKKIAFVSKGGIWVVPVHGKVSPDIAGEPIRLPGTEKAWHWCMSWSADGAWIAYGNPGEICIVPSSGGKVRRISLEVSSGSNVFDCRLSMSGDGRTVAYGSKVKDRMQIFTADVESGDFKQLTEDGGTQPCFSPDGKRIAYVKTKPQKTEIPKSDVCMIPAAGGTPVRVSDLPGKATGPIWSPDGKRIAFTRKTGGDDMSKEVCIVPVRESGKPEATPTQIELPLETWRHLAGWTPDNDIGVLLSNPEHQAIYTVPASGGNATQVTPQGYTFHPKWSPDGERIYFRWNGGAIASVPSEGGEVSIGPLYANSGIFVALPGGGNAVSPDGKKITFSGAKEVLEGKERRYEVDIYTIPVEGGEPTQLTTSPGQDRFPCWSPDGKKIAFIRYGEPSKEMRICIVPTEGGEIRQLTSESHRVKWSTIAWSPDGELIAYFNGKNINVIPAEGGEPRVVVKVADVSAHSELAWSPDGSKLVYSSKGSIWVVSPDGGEPEEIETGLDAKASHISWSPDGEKMAFSATRDGDVELWLMENFLPEAVAAAGQ